MLSKERIHYLDAMRAILMIFGILLHAANIFSPTHSWLISSNETSMLFAGISNFINLFRMPAFFMVSGFFFVHVYLKKHRIAITDRLIRLLVPIVFVALTLNIIQETLINAYNDQALDLVNFFTDGGWVSHLWFLINLAIYNVGFWILIMIKPLNMCLQKISNFLAKGAVYPVAIIAFPFFISGIYSLNYFLDIYNEIFGIISPLQLLFYAQFFVIGLFFGYSQELLGRFSKPGKIEFITFLLAYFLSLIFRELTTKASLLHDVVIAYNHSVLILFLSSMCFFFFRRFLDFKSRFLSLISASSYSIYLLHHFLVVALGIVFIELPVSIYIAYPLIVIITFIITMGAHQGISRSPILSFFINGLRPGKTQNTKDLNILSASNRS